MEQQIQQVIKQLFEVDVDVTLTRPDSQFGDYATSVAMQLAKPLGKNPREIAEQLATELRNSDDFSDVSVAGPGFINLKVHDSVLDSELKKMIDQSSRYGMSRLYQDKVVVTEYSDPNPFKVLHVGHFYTSVIGDAISNLIQ